MTTFRFLTPRPRLVGYLSGLALEPVEGDKFVTLAEADILAFADHLSTSQKIAPGFRFDYASIPRWGRWAISKQHNDYAHATVCHDYLYSHHKECRAMANALGYHDPRLFADDLMLVMSNTKSWRPVVMYWALRWFGAKYWNEYKKDTAK